MKICTLCSKSFPFGDVCPYDGTPLVTPAFQGSTMIGRILKDDYRIEEEIASGGMGAVFRGTQIRLGRNVAIKTLLPKFQSTPEMVQRFFLEARLLSQLNHPNIISIIDFGSTEDGLMYMVMEYLQGKTLRDFVPMEQGLTLHQIVGIMEQICGGVDAAHSLPLIHRDLKPANIFLTRIGQGYVVKILDFGIGKRLDDDNRESITKTGFILGTAGYIAPEQIAGNAKIDHTSDIYALGAILYFMMGGQKPFSGETDHTVLYKQIKENPEPIPLQRLLQPEIAELMPVVLKAMSHTPSDRYASASELMMAISSAVGGKNELIRGSLISFDSGEMRRVPVSEMETHKLGEAATETNGKRFEPRSGRVQERNPKDVSFLKTQELQPVEEEVTKAPKRRHKSLLPALGVGLLVLASALFWLFKGAEKPKEPLVFGMSAAFTGPTRELGRNMKLGIDTCFNRINEEGGIHDRKLQLIALDDGYEPERAAANVRELLAKKVLGLVGNVGTPTAEMTVPIANQSGLLFYGAFTGADLLRKDPPDHFVINYRASYAEETAAIVHYLVKIKKIQPNQIAVFAQEDGFGDSGFRGVRLSLRDLGIEESQILRVGYKRNTIQVDAAVSEILRNSERAKAIILVGTYKPCSIFIKDLRQQGHEALFACVSFVGAKALSEEFKELGSVLAEGVMVSQVVPYYGSNSKMVLDYRKALAKYFPNEPPDFISLEGYIAAELLVEALKQVKEPIDSESLIQALESIKNLDMGIGAPISLGPSNHQASSKVWFTIMDGRAEYRELSLE